jgi:hypothetical protein
VSCTRGAGVPRGTLSVSNSLSGGDGEMNKVPAVGDPTQGVDEHAPLCVQSRNAVAFGRPMMRGSEPHYNNPKPGKLPFTAGSSRSGTEASVPSN